MHTVSPPTGSLNITMPNKAGNGLFFMTPSPKVPRVSSPGGSPTHGLEPEILLRGMILGIQVTSSVHVLHTSSVCYHSERLQPGSHCHARRATTRRFMRLVASSRTPFAGSWAWQRLRQAQSPWITRASLVSHEGGTLGGCHSVWCRCSEHFWSPG